MQEQTRSDYTRHVDPDDHFFYDAGTVTNPIGVTVTKLRLGSSLFKSQRYILA